MKSCSRMGIWELSLLVNSIQKPPVDWLVTPLPGPRAELLVLLLLPETMGPSRLTVRVLNGGEPPLSWEDFPSDSVTKGARCASVMRILAIFWGKDWA